MSEAVQPAEGRETILISLSRQAIVLAKILRETKADNDANCNDYQKVSNRSVSEDVTQEGDDFGSGRSVFASVPGVVSFRNATAKARKREPLRCMSSYHGPASRADPLLTY